MKKPKRSEIAFKNAYIDLLLNEDRDKIFVRTICEKSGYSAMCFYQNYVSKEKFTQKIIDDEIEFYIDNLAEFSDLLYSCNATEEACVKCKKKFFDHIYENKDLYRCIFSNKLAPETDHLYERKISERLIKSINSNELRILPIVNTNNGVPEIKFDENHAPGVCNDKNDYMIWFVVRNRMIGYLLAEIWCKNDFNLSPLEMAECFYRMMLILDGGSFITKYSSLNMRA